MEDILQMLPVEPREEMMRWAAKELDRQLGLHLLTYKRAQYIPEDGEIGWPLYQTEEPRPKWAARCKCSACGEEWYSAWLGDGIRMYVDYVYGDWQNPSADWSSSSRPDHSSCRF